jgi:hypothetical protein
MHQNLVAGAHSIAREVRRRTGIGQKREAHTRGQRDGAACIDAVCPQIVDHNGDLRRAMRNDCRRRQTRLDFAVAAALGQPIRKTTPRDGFEHFRRKRTRRDIR